MHRAIAHAAAPPHSCVRSRYRYVGVPRGLLCQLVLTAGLAHGICGSAVLEVVLVSRAELRLRAAVYVKDNCLHLAAAYLVGCDLRWQPMRTLCSSCAALSRTSAPSVRVDGGYLASTSTGVQVFPAASSELVLAARVKVSAVDRVALEYHMRRIFRELQYLSAAHLVGTDSHLSSRRRSLCCSSASWRRGLQ